MRPDSKHSPPIKTASIIEIIDGAYIDSATELHSVPVTLHFNNKQSQTQPLTGLVAIISRFTRTGYMP